MYQSNDYLKLTKEYLKNMRYHEQALKNLRADAATLKHELSNENLLSSSSAEKQDYVRDLKRQDLIRLENSILRLDNHLQKMRESLHQLSHDEQEILDLIYDKRYTAIYAGECVGLCERSVHRHVRAAVGNLAVMLFGTAALDEISFVRS